MDGAEVVFVASTLVVGGAERAVATLVRGLPARGFPTRVWTLRAPGPVGEALAREGVPVTARVRWPGRFFTRRRPRAVYCLDHRNALLTVVPAAAAAGVPVRLVSVHTMRRADGSPSLDRFERVAARCATRIVAVAAKQRELLAREVGAAGPAIEVVPLGIDLSRYAGGGPASARARLGLGETSYVIACIAQLRPEKGHDVLLAAFRDVRAQVPDAVLLLAGDGGERAALETRARDLGVDAAVRFLGLRDDVPDLLAACDVSVLASRPVVETTPTAAIESMAAARPVVATRVGAVEEIVADGETGTLVPTGDAGALARALVDLARDPARRAALGARGRARALGLYSADRMIDDTAALIERLSPGGSRR